jgi:(p)ppGpp synthase/HD superfamily hydrolase
MPRPLSEFRLLRPSGTNLFAPGALASTVAAIFMGETTTRTEPRTKSDLVTAALRFARRVHLGQHRKQTYEQFVEHPIEVARLLSEQGLDGPILAAAYLHDTVEKTPVEIEELRERFGPEVAALVDSLSDDPEIEDYAARKRALRTKVLAAGDSAVLIYAADRLANMRDWHSLPCERRDACAARLGTNLTERLELWSEDLEGFSQLDHPVPFLSEMELELQALGAERQREAVA